MKKYKNTKSSYFNPSRLEIEEPYDMNKWNYISKMIIYDHGRLGKDKSLDYHSYVNIKDPKELEKFRMWHKTQKVSGDKMSKLKKTSREQYGVSGIGIYPTDTGSTFDEKDYSVSKAEKIRRSMEYEKKYGPIPKEDSPEEHAKKRKNELARRMNKYIILLQKNLMSSEDVDLETFQKSLQLLNGLADVSKKIKTAEMGIDLMYRTSNRLGKYGLKKHANDLKRFAQQQEQDISVEPPAPAPDPQPPVDQQIPQEGTNPELNQNQAPEQNQVERRDPGLEALDASSEVEPVKFSDIETEGPGEGEYDKIIDDSISMSDAAEKLEDVASMLADRRVIRYLAEFDIMLDKLGVASMFPELAESQSKLIDAYSYALTRVSKMMGQLANAAEILKGMEGKVPGSSDADVE